jgi:hypothetical protein
MARHVGAVFRTRTASDPARLRGGGGEHPLGKIHHLVSFGADEPPPAQPPADEADPADGQSGQDLADEILRRFEG